MQYTARGLSTATRLSNKLFIVDSRYVFDIYVLDFSNFFLQVFYIFPSKFCPFHPLLSLRNVPFPIVSKTPRIS